MHFGLFTIDLIIIIDRLILIIYTINTQLLPSKLTINYFRFAELYSFFVLFLLSSTIPCVVLFVPYYIQFESVSLVPARIRLLSILLRSILLNQFTDFHSLKNSSPLLFLRRIKLPHHTVTTALTGLPVKAQLPSEGTVLILAQMRLQDRVLQFGRRTQCRRRTVRIIDLILYIRSTVIPARRGRLTGLRRLQMAFGIRFDLRIGENRTRHLRLSVQDRIRGPIVVAGRRRGGGGRRARRIARVILIVVRIIIIVVRAGDQQLLLVVLVHVLRVLIVMDQEFVPLVAFTLAISSAANQSGRR